MLYLSENLRKFRIEKNLTQEDVAQYLSVTAQSVSTWERGDCYPDITLLPALANIFDTSIDLLVGMDVIRAERTRNAIHSKATDFQRSGDYQASERVYRDALRIYPNKPGMILGLAGALALQGKTDEAIDCMERGLPLSVNEKQKATMRAVLCFLYLRRGDAGKAGALASTLPHTRESREVIAPLITKGMDDAEIGRYIRFLMLGESKEIS